MFVVARRFAGSPVSFGLEKCGQAVGVLVLDALSSMSNMRERLLVKGEVSCYQNCSK